jgi:hypothetical protein
MNHTSQAVKMESTQGPDDRPDDLPCGVKLSRARTVEEMVPEGEANYSLTLIELFCILVEMIPRSFSAQEERDRI